MHLSRSPLLSPWPRFVAMVYPLCMLHVIYAHAIPISMSLHSEIDSITLTSCNFGS